MQIDNNTMHISFNFPSGSSESHSTTKPPFTLTPGVVPVMTSEDPVDFFNLLFDEEVKNLIHTQTTLYAEQYMRKKREHLEQHPKARANDWQRNPMTPKEVDILIAVLIGMGIVGYPTIR